MGRKVWRPYKCSLVALFLLAGTTRQGLGANPDLSKAILQAAPNASLIEPFTAGAPKYHVFRLNSEPVKFRGEHYGLVRIRIPAGPPKPLVWMFSDIGSIQEYEIVRLLDGKPIRGNLRVIYPRLRNLDHEAEQDDARRPLHLPRPWDMFELHILGVPESLLSPGEDYVIWFRFEDNRPVDLIMSAVFPDPGTTLSEPALPAIMGLPELAPP
jgi:hypothetical protein